MVCIKNFINFLFQNLNSQSTQADFQNWKSLIDLNNRKFSCLRLWIWISKTNHFASNDNTTLLSNDSTSLEENLKNLRLKDPILVYFCTFICKPIITHSVRNKFNLLSDIIKKISASYWSQKGNLIFLFLKDSFNFMATLNHINLIEMEMVVEHPHSFLIIYSQNLNLK